MDEPIAMVPIRIGVFFGGLSREREISFAGGRTVCDHLDRNFFEPIPIFVDSLGNFIRLDWRYLYQGTIREFYPPPAAAHFLGCPLYIESLVESHKTDLDQYILSIGKKVVPEDFLDHFDMVFLCLHGPYGEDGAIQGLLRWYQIPYSGSAILPSALCLDKIFQQKLLKSSGFSLPRSCILSQEEWLNAKNKSILLDGYIATLGLPFVVKSSTQGSSIGVTIVERNEVAPFIEAIYKAFFMEALSYDCWIHYTEAEKQDWLCSLIDIRSGIGFPLRIDDQCFYTPDRLLDYIEKHFQQTALPLILISTQAEQNIIVEAFVAGREFSCIVLEPSNGNPIALPPTEMLKGRLHFDYKAKYLPGIVRKETPMALPASLLNEIRTAAVALFQLLACQVYARIDGFLTEKNELFLNDPNSTVGMNPSSFLFHQAAEIGLTPTQLLTFIIKRSLEVRAREGYLVADRLLKQLDAMVAHEMK